MRSAGIAGMPLFHNHLSIEAVLPVFPFGSPPFSRLVSMIRHETIREVAKSELPGVIFTFVWAFDAVEEQGYVQGLVDVFEGLSHPPRRRYRSSGTSGSARNRPIRQLLDLIPVQYLDTQSLPSEVEGDGSPEPLHLDASVLS